MGNCLVIHYRKEMKIMSVDYGSSQVFRVQPSPSRFMKVQDDDSLGEPLPAASVLPVKKAPAGTVRVKLVISKRELKRMLDKEEGMSLDDVVSVSLMRKEASDREQVEYCSGGWRPALETIPEGSDVV
jgi:hypothetical protein